MLRSSPAAGLLPKGQLITAQSTAANDFKRFLHCSLVGSFINLYNTLQGKLVDIDYS
jgi:hypothetical protein